MCLGIPGKITKVYEKDNIRMASVDINGILVDTCLETTPEAKMGDYVIVHAGFALTVMNQSEALETLAMLNQMEDIGNADEAS